MGFFFSSRNPIHSRQDSLNRESAGLKAATYTQNSTNTEYTQADIHESSGIRTQNLAGTVIGFEWH
jgi:hypothetical protein